MRVVLDTNVVVAAIVARGNCHEVWNHCAIRRLLFTSRPLVNELVEALRRQPKLTPALVSEARTLLLASADLVEPAEVAAGSCRDPDDLVVLGTAVAARADCLVSGDKDLLELGAYSDIPIVSPRGFWLLAKDLAP